MMQDRRQGPPGPALCGALMLACATLMSACSADPRQGYSFQSSYPTDITTITVPIFKNYTATPGIETELTEAIIKEVQSTTPMKATSGDPADSRLVGVITGLDMRRLDVRSQTGLVQELAVQITVDFDWTDSRSGKVLTSRRSFSAADTFVPAVGVRERVETGQQAAVQRLAHDIVAEMRSAW